MVRAGLSIDRLIEAGAKLADQSGFDSVTPSALAKVFDVKVASLYSHLRNAHELKTRLALFALAKLSDHAAQAVAGRSGKDALVAFANVQRLFAHEHPGLFVATRFPLDPDVAASSGGVTLSRLMRAVLRSYALSEPAETDAVRLLGSTLLGFVVLEAAGSFGHSAPEPEVSWLAMLDALDSMLRHWPLGDSAAR